MRVPDELKQIPNWVCAFSNSKTPMRADCYQAALLDDPSTWAIYEAAKQSVDDGHYQNLGFVFSDDLGIVAIDIDAGFDESGLISDLALDIINQCKSYTEISRSGRGFHILVKGTLPVKGANNRSGVEIYKTGRYFILTGNVMCYDEIIENQSAIDYVFSKYFNQEHRITDRTKFDNFYQLDWKPTDPEKIRIEPVYPLINQGARNMSLLSLGGSLLTAGYPDEHIEQILTRTNLTKCKPPLDEDEVHNIIRSLKKYRR